MSDFQGGADGLHVLTVASMTRTIAGEAQRASMLVGGSRTGLLYAIPDLRDNGSRSAPTPLVDNSTKLLFTSSVIEAS